MWAGRGSQARLAGLSFAEALQSRPAAVAGFVGLAQLMQASVRDGRLVLITHQLLQAALVH